MLAGIIPNPHRHIQLFIIFTTAAPKDETRVGVPCAKRYVNINVIFSMAREEKAVGREMFYMLCLRLSFPAQQRRLEGRRSLHFSFRPNLKAGPCSENSPIQASGLPFSLMVAKSHPGGSSPELVQTPNWRWDGRHPLWACFFSLI